MTIDEADVCVSPEEHDALLDAACEPEPEPEAALSKKGLGDLSLSDLSNLVMLLPGPLRSVLIALLVIVPLGGIGYEMGWISQEEFAHIKSEWFAPEEAADKSLDDALEQLEEIEGALDKVQHQCTEAEEKFQNIRAYADSLQVTVDQMQTQLAAETAQHKSCERELTTTYERLAQCRADLQGD